jgi:Tfp pilus assembly protein PilZ
MEEAIKTYNYEKSEYDPEPLQKLKRAKKEVEKYSSYLYFVRVDGKIVENEDGEMRYFTDVASALRILNERERSGLSFYKVWIDVLDHNGEVNEINTKRILNVNK